MSEFRSASRLLIVSGVLAAMTLSGQGVSRAEPPPNTSPEAQAAALITPAVVVLQTTSRGWVFDNNGNPLHNGAPIEIEGQCTGFTVKSDGYIATAGHCVDPRERRNDIIQAVAEEQAKHGGNINDLVAFGSANWVVEGETRGTPPDFQVLISGAGSRDRNAKPLPARVLDVRPLGEGDVALLKVEPPPQVTLPSSELAPQGEPQIGQPILAVGYPASTAQITDPTLEPAVKSGSISARDTLQTQPVFQVSAAMTPGMSGGPTVDLQGRVIGLNSFGPADEPQPFNYIAPVQGLRELLARNGVEAGLSPADTAYRNGLNDLTKGQYTNAIDNFGQAEALSGNRYPNASEKKIEAIKLRAERGDASSGGVKPWVFIVGGIVLVAIIAGGVLIYVLSRRNPEPALPGGSVGASPSPASRSGSSAARPPASGSAASQSPGGSPPPPSTAGGGGNCHNCGYGLAPGAQFCPRCGKPQG